MDDALKRILSGARVRDVIAEGAGRDYSVSSECLSDLQVWWKDIVEAWAEGEGEDVDASYVSSQVSLVLPQDLVFFGNIANETFSVDQFMEVLAMADIDVPSDVELSRDAYSGGVKVSFTGISPEEFTKRLV